MTNKENQGKKIYDKASKKWYAVSNEFYKAYDRWRTAGCNIAENASARAANGGCATPTSWIVNSTSRHQYRLMSPLF